MCVAHKTQRVVRATFSVYNNINITNAGWSSKSEQNAIVIKLVQLGLRITTLPNKKKAWTSLWQYVLEMMLFYIFLRVIYD